MAKAFAARCGPIVWEEDGPLPILNISLMDSMSMLSYSIIYMCKVTQKVWFIGKIYDYNTCFLFFLPIWRTNLSLWQCFYCGIRIAIGLSSLIRYLSETHINNDNNKNK
ncbi:hypothetical protein PRRU23_25690 [Segatella bryantii]|uniref:Uncharacterized protein n=1 Tax=Segatella bryantii TaxID=77095 RepID=A0AA37MMK2_SEGBR|nr:hypothetical protein PRRU23_25690 [Segatella bryantii]